MSTYKHNCTKGPAPEIMNGSDNGWATCTMQRDGLHVVVTAPHASEMDNGEWDHPEKAVEMEANASLIAEAFNVLHETGMTPRELVELLKAAHDAMSKVAEMCHVHNPHTGFLRDVNPYDAYRALLPSMVAAGEALTSKQTTT